MVHNVLTDLLMVYVPKTHSVLDVGVGCDPPSVELHNDRVGCDVSLIDLKESSNVSDKVLLDANVSLPFRDKCFDTVLALDVIEHLPAKGGNHLVREAERIAKKQTIFYTPNSFLPQSGFERLHRHKGDHQRHKSGYKAKFFTDKGYHIQKVVGDRCHKSAYDCLFAVKEKRRMIKTDYGLVSVIIPTYNRPTYLREAITSVLNQTYPNFEVIVIDDGGQTNKTKEICTDLNVRYYWKPNGGTASALNYGVKRMRGEWFKWLSDDDYLAPSALETLLEAKQKIVYSEYFKVDERSIVTTVFNEPDYDNHSFMLNLFDHHIGNASSSLIHRSVLEEIGLFRDDYKIHEDYEFWLRASVKHRLHFHLIHRKLLFYRVHKSQLTTDSEVLRLREEINNLIRQNILSSLNPRYKRYFLRELEINRKWKPPKQIIRAIIRKLLMFIPSSSRTFLISVWRRR